MKHVLIDLFEFSELSYDAKQIAIENQKNFLDNTPIEYEDENGKMVDEYLTHTEEEVIENIETNGYLYFENGKMAYVLYHVGEHNRVEKIELLLHGSRYPIQTKNTKTK